MDKLICVGKNYLDHARELGDAVPELPVLFLKPPSCVRQARNAQDVLHVNLPQGRGSIHHECEIVLRLNAQNQIDAVTLGLDMTLRDVQAKIKKDGHPWEISKVFAGAALMGPWIPLHEKPHYLDEIFSLTVQGQIRQKGEGRNMRLGPEACIRHAAAHFELCAGDALFTGTPAGVGPVLPGDSARLEWAGQTILQVRWE